METTPTPVNLNALKGILGNAKKVMQQTDATNPIALSEITQKQTATEHVETAPNPAAANPAHQAPQAYNKEQVMASNLPPAIKEAMIKNPITPVNMNNTSNSFQLEDMSELEDMKMTPNVRPTQTRMNENIVNTNSDMINISKSELKNIVNETVIEILTKNYTKQISEAAIKKTINLLIKEGKINVKKKKA